MTSPRPVLDRRAFLAITGLSSIAGAAALTGCSEVTGKAAGTTTPGGSKTNGVITIGAPVTNNQFPENFNANGGGDPAPGIGLFYETLFRVSQLDAGKLIPNLALSVKYTDGGRTATYKLRDGVTWNDGKKFTADDVVFTYNFVFGEPGKGQFLRKKVYKTDDLTVVVPYNDPNYQEDTNLSEYYPIYPKHIYSKHGDHSKYQDKHPVGTGPGKLKTFNTERIEVEVREDWWAGKIPGVTSLVFVPQGTVGNVQSQISQGKVDWSDGGGQGVLTTFLKQSPDNKYAFWPDGSNTGLQFNCWKGVTQDKQLRRALRAAIDPQAIQKAIGSGYPIPSLSGLDPQMYRGLLLPGYEEAYSQDPEAAKKELSKGGWKVKNGQLTKGGKTYPLELMVNLDQPDHMVAAPMLIDFWKTVLGLEVKQVGRADQVFQKQIHDHTMAIWNVNLNGSAYNAFQAYSHANLADEAQKNGYGNQGKWRAPDAVNNALLKLKATSPSDTKAVKKQLLIIQKGIIDEAPVVPFLPGGGGVMTTVKNWVGWPVYGKSDHPPFSSRTYNNTSHTLLDLKSA